MVYDYLTTPIGELLLAADDHGLTHVELPHEAKPTTPRPDWRRDPAALAAAREQFAAWFAGERLDFELPLAPRGTPFQLAVWRALAAIPYATTTSYGALAGAIGRPRAVRAVGAANGANPLAIILPCHRVIGANGQLTGYGGGLPMKRWLLDHERRHAPRPVLDALRQAAAGVARDNR